MAVSERRYLTKNTTCSVVAKYLGFTPQNICAFGYVLLNTKYLATSLEANRYRLEEIERFKTVTCLIF